MKIPDNAGGSHPILSGMKLKFVKSDNLSDWYLIERAEHEGKSWMQPTEYGSAFMTSSRIGDADIEGTAAEMLDIADAIEKRRDESFKRVGFRINGDQCYFRSPRNTNNEGPPCTLAEADDLAQQIRTTLG